MNQEQELDRLKAIRDEAEQTHMTNVFVKEISLDNYNDARDKCKESWKELQTARDAYMAAMGASLHRGRGKEAEFVASGAMLAQIRCWIHTLLGLMGTKSR
jgi:glucosamine 6-phosphate synthetase-like amidotransferase/phosphosugar isomerase protein